MKFTKTFTIILALLMSIFSFSLAGCKSSEERYSEDRYIDFLFETAFTEEEHIQRIRERTNEKLAEDIEKGIIDTIDVEIVYSFWTEDPEYFLVEVKYNQWIEGYWPKGSRDKQKYHTKDRYFFGMIYKDAYIGLHETTDFQDGKSIYEVRGYSSNKKYYGNSVFAVEQDGKIYQIFHGWIGFYSTILGLDDMMFKNEEDLIIKELSIGEQLYRLKWSREVCSGNYWLGLNYLY